MPEPTDAISVLVADAQALVAESLAVALSRSDRLAVLPEHPTSGIDAIAAVERHRPDIAVLDYWLLRMDGPAVTRTLKKCAPDTKVINLSGFVISPEHVQLALDAGAVGFLPKSASLGQVEEAIARAHAGEDPVFADELQRLLGRIVAKGQRVEREVERLATLTARELEVLRLLGAGLTVDRIAGRLDISVNTVRAHVRHMLSKTDTQGQVELLAIAREHRVIP